MFHYEAAKAIKQNGVMLMSQQSSLLLFLCLNILYKYIHVHLFINLLRYSWYLLSFFGRLYFLLLGILHVKKHGKFSEFKEAPIMVVAPHSSLFDSLVVFCNWQMPSPLSRIENYRAPGFGSRFKLLVSQF